MAKFAKKQSRTVKLPVEVFWGNESQGELNVEFKKIDQSQFDDLVENGNDYDLCKAVIVGVEDIPVEGSEEALTGQEALDEWLSDISCVAASAARYIGEFKGDNFRKSRSRKRS